jgi:hypothetical protein
MEVDATSFLFFRLSPSLLFLHLVYLTFEDNKRERERQLKERKKLLDGSSSEESGDGDSERDETQTGAYDSLTPLGTTTRTSPYKRKHRTRTNRKRT